MNAPVRRAAFVVTPHAGGTFAVYRSLRIALAQQGISLDWVGHSDHPEAIRSDPGLGGIFSHGHLIDSRGKSPEQTATALLHTLIEEKYELVFINVLTGPAEMVVAAYLPPEVKRVMIVHSITPGTYDGARAVAPFVHAAVCVCPRNRDHLVHRLRLPAEKVFCVPNAVDTGPFKTAVRVPKGQTTRILFLGRIIEIDKGVFWLPEIMRQLADVDCRLTVAGDGPDFAALKERCAFLGERVRFLGRVAAAAIPELAAGHDLFLMTSRFEGLPVALVEAMAGGCVPVASRITGVTDFVVKEGETGLLFPVGDVVAAAAAVRTLAGDEQKRQRMAAAGLPDVEARFSIPAMGRGYGEVLRFLETAPAPEQMRNGAVQLLHIKGGWRRLIPQGVKNTLRKWHYGRA